MTQQMETQSLAARLRRGPRRLWTRYMALYGTATVLTSLALVAVVVAFVYQTEQNSWRGRQGEAAQSAATTVGAAVQSAVDTLAHFARWGRAALADQPAQLATILDQNPAFQEVIFLDAQGQLLAQAQRGRPVLADLFTIPQANWFQAARAGRTYFSDAQISSMDSPYLIMALPAGNGEILAARLDLAALWRVVAEIHFGEHGRVYIVNGRGEVIAHTNPAVVLAQTNLAGRPELAAITQASGGHWQGAYIDLSGIPVVGAAALVPGTDWRVVAELPQAEAFAASRTAVFVLAGLLLGIGGVLSFVVARLLQTLIRLPLAQIQEGAERLGHGDLSYRIPVARRDEIGVVAEAFNQMADRLGVRDAELAAQAEALRASEARYRAIVEDQTELICRWRPDGTLTFVNEAYCRYFGRPREALVGCSFLPLIPDEDQAQLAAHLERLSAEQPVETIEHRVILADGEVRWQHWTDRALCGPDGAIVEYAGVGRDITERRAAQARLEAVESYYRNLFEEAPVMYVITRAEPDGPRIVACNRQFLQTLGYPAAEVIGRRLAEFYTSASPAPLREGHAAALAGEVVSQDRELVARDGRIVQALLWAVPDLDAEGQAVGTRALFVDFTSRARAEAALRESEARFKLALEVARAGAWEWDLAANRLVWSDENYRLMGLTPGSVTPALEHWLAAVHPDDRPAAAVAVASAVESRQGFDTEFRVVWPDGSWHWLRAVGHVLLGPDGFPRATVGLQQDITERKQAEAALRESAARHQLLADELQQLNNELETRVRQRTAELAQANAALGASETRLRRITDNMLDMIAQVDAEGRYEYVSPSYQEVLGYAPGELLGRPLLDLLHPDDTEPARSANLAAAKSRLVVSLEARFRHADGRYLWTESVGNPLRDAQDRVVGTIVGSRDITERKQAELRAAAFSTLGHRLSAATNMEAAARVIMAAADELLGWDVFYIDLYQAERGLMQSVLVIDTLDDGRRVDVTAEYPPYPPTATTHRVMAEGELLLNLPPGQTQIPGLIYFGDGEHNPAALMFVPIRKEAHFLGVLSIQSYRPNAYAAPDLQTLQALADHGSGALERLRAEAEVHTSLREKVVMLQEIHHRVKNNLQVISSLLSLQSRSVNDPAVLELLRDSQNRVRSMALVHEKLYRSSDLARIDLGEYARSLAGQLQRSYADAAGRVALRVEAADCWLDVDAAVPCGLIINELVSNALKHAFPEARTGQILVTVRPAGAGRLALAVADDGVGFPAGLDFRASPSLGLQLVNSLAAQLDGTLSLNRAAGTEFVIEFPAGRPEA